MGKRGPKPKGKVRIKWSHNFAYAVGLIATDGNLSGSGRHIIFISKDIEQVDNFQSALGIKFKIGRKSRAKSKEKKYYMVQIGDVLFYDFLVSIGITPAKSMTLGQIGIPSEYFIDFLRGVLDGDGYVHSYFDPRWRSSFLWYIGFCSASPAFLNWIRSELRHRLGVNGHITKNASNSCRQLKYAKQEAGVIAGAIYKNRRLISLSRKRLKVQRILDIVKGLSRYK
ncbi:MAG: hypothetical protein NT077_04335 [Candidatus Taylorbacteria bacterium]|nr:hypothetical protein [Candidatus Taylorbacteria bacterium]